MSDEFDSESLDTEEREPSQQEYDEFKRHLDWQGDRIRELMNNLQAAQVTTHLQISYGVPESFTYRIRRL